MKDGGKLINKRVKAVLSIQTVTYMMVIGSKTKLKAMETISIWMVRFIKDCGRMINRKVQE